MLIATPAGSPLSISRNPQSERVYTGTCVRHPLSRGRTISPGTLARLSVLEDGVVKASYTISNSPAEDHWIHRARRVGDDWFARHVRRWRAAAGRDGQWRSFPEASDAFVVNPNAMLVTEAASTPERSTAASTPMIAHRRWTAITAGLPSRNVTALAARGATYI